MPDTAPRVPTVFAIGRLAGILRAEFADRMAGEDWVHEAGLRPPSYGVLRAIESLQSHQPASQREVSDRIGLHPSDLVPVIDHLESVDWVDRTRDPDDRRRYMLSLTAAGRDALARLDRIATEVEDTMLASLTDEQRSALDDVVASLLSAHLGTDAARRAADRAKLARRD